METRLYGHTFDHNRFLNFIHEASGSGYLDESSTFFGVYLNFRKYSRTNANHSDHLSWWMYTNDVFKAHGALADTKALRKVCSESTYSDRIFKEIISKTRQLSSIRKRALFEVREKHNEQELFELLKLDTSSKRMAKLGISVQISKWGDSLV